MTDAQLATTTSMELLQRNISTLLELLSPANRGTLSVDAANSALYALKLTAETALKLTELAHADALSGGTETVRLKAETARVYAETDRVNAEAERLRMETAKVRAETDKTTADVGRLRLEVERVKAETEYQRVCRS